MKNLKGFEEYNKTNEEFQFLGFDVVITLGELIESITAAVFIVGIGATIGIFSLKNWINNILSDRRKIKAAKKLSDLLEKYRDNVIDRFINKMKTQIHYDKTKETGKATMISQDFVELSEYLKNKMSEEDKAEYNKMIDIIGYYGNKFKV